MDVDIKATIVIILVLLLVFALFTLLYLTTERFTNWEKWQEQKYDDLPRYREYENVGEYDNEKNNITKKIE